MEDDFARKFFNRIISRLRGLCGELRARQAQRVLRQRHVKAVEHHMDVGLRIGRKAELAVELVALSRAIGAVAAGRKSAVVSDQAIATYGI